MKKVFVTEHLAEAYRVRDQLREMGIEAEVANELLSGGAASEVPLELSTLPTVWIADESRAEEARAIVAALEKPADAPAWTCSGCGHENPGSFTDCPTCGRARSAGAADS